jgi:hypothetical protein
MIVAGSNDHRPDRAMTLERERVCLPCMLFSLGRLFSRMETVSTCSCSCSITEAQLPWWMYSKVDHAL